MEEITDIEFSPEVGELFGALSKAQGQIGTITRDRTVSVKPRDSAAYSYNYATLSNIREACREPLSENGLMIVQAPSCDGETVSVTTRMGHASGQWMQSRLTLPLGQRTAQGIGGVITYARRYALSAMLGLASEEDDDALVGDGVPGAAKERPKPAARTREAAPESASQERKSIWAAGPGDNGARSPESAGDRRAQQSGTQPSGDELANARKAWHAGLKDHTGNLEPDDRHAFTSLLVGEKVTSEQNWDADRYRNARQKLNDHVKACPIKLCTEGMCPLVGQVMGIQDAGEMPPPPADVPAAADGNVCSQAGCGKPLTPGQKSMSVNKFGAPLCPACQKTKLK